MRLINLSLFLLFILPIKYSFSNDIKFTGLLKLNLEDLNSITSTNLSKNDYSLDEVNRIVKELYSSELIENVNLDILEDYFLINISETKLIENIFINGNVQLKDENIISNLQSKPNYLVNKKFIKEDINLIKQMYLSSGYYNISITSSFEKFSNDKINLIFDVFEGEPYQISKIDFNGNKFFSDRFLINLISSRSLNFLNFLTPGSNFNPELFEFDKKKILSKYKEKGFFNARITHKLVEINNSKFELSFYIQENERLLISKIVTENDIENDLIFQNFYTELNKKILNNNNFYDLSIIQKEIDVINQSLIDSNIYSYSYQASILEEDNVFFLSIYKNIEKQLLINQINLQGNSITSDKVLRSKLYLEPGDYFLDYNKNKSYRRLNSLRYINSVDIIETESNDAIDLDIIVDENKKTGNFLLAGSFSGDTGLGFALGLNDYNFLGSGNELNSSFNINTEQARFSINYKQYLINNPSISNNYTIFNIENDLTDSFGFKSQETGFGYSIGYDYSDKVSMSFGIKYSKENNYSGINSNNYIQDNIGDFDQFTLNYTASRDTTNDIFYPTKGLINKITFQLSPDVISDDSYYKIRLNNDYYISKDEKDNFFFISNRFGFADSLNGNLKTTNAFSLGGLNFKGFDYRGLGPSDTNTYLGGNNFYTLTLGYGGQFLFDKKDNINFRTFITSGSIWDSDYAANNEFKNRLSAGLSLDIMTAVFPISFSYAVPIQKEDKDIEKRFNFTIGTSF